MHEYAEFAIRILVAVFLSALIGLEREFHGRSAGVRTNVLVGIGSTLFTILSIIIAQDTVVPINGLSAVPDPGRIAAQIITGIGFLGAGAIVKYGVNIRGLTTAASMWIIASIGMACGIGEYALASLVTLITLISLAVLPYVNGFIPSYSYRTLLVKRSEVTQFDDVYSIVEKKAKILSTDYDYQHSAKEYTARMNLRFLITGKTDSEFLNMGDEILKLEKVKAIKWHK